MVRAAGRPRGPPYGPALAALRPARPWRPFGPPLVLRAWPGPPFGQPGRPPGGPSAGLAATWPKLPASTVSGLGDDPGRAAGRSVRRDLAGALPQVHLGVLASGLHALFGGTSPTPTFLSASSSGRSAVRSRRPQPPPSPPGLTVAPTHSSPPPRPGRDRRDRRPDRSGGPLDAHSGLSSCRRPDPPPRPLAVGL